MASTVLGAWEALVETDRIMALTVADILSGGIQKINNNK